MKILVNKSFVSLSLLSFVLVGILLLSLSDKYYRWGFINSDIIPFVLSVTVAVGLIILSYVIYCSILNPLSAFSFFIIGYGYSFVKFQYFTYELSLISNVVLISSILSFILGVFISVIIKNTMCPIKLSTKHRKMILLGTIGIGLGTFILEIYKIGYIPIMKIMTEDVYGKANEQLIPILHYFVMLFAIIPAWNYIYYKKGIINKIFLHGIFICATFIMLNFMSRQIILMFLLTFFLTYLHYNKVSRKKMILFVALPLIMFLGIGSLRLLHTEVDALEYLRGYTGVFYETSLVETYMSLYSTRNFYTFDLFVRNMEVCDYSSYGAYTFSPLLTITLMNRILGIEINPMFDSNKALGTYAIEPYMDFGFTGVFLINIGYGLICGIIYKGYLAKKVDSIIPWATLLFCILMMVFTNYFNMFYIWMVIALNKIIVKHDSETNICKVK